jgi:uncharacterized membrane protein YfcA
MNASWLFVLGGIAGAGAGLLAGLVGIGGGIVVVPVIYYGLVMGGTAPDQAAHVAVATSLAAILPTAIVSSIGHWRAGNADLRFLRDWGPGIVVGVVLAQLAAPHLRGSVLTGTFGILCLVFAIRFGFPDRFRPVVDEPPNGSFRLVAAAGIGVSSGLAGIGGGIMTNIVMTLSGMPMHKSIGRAAAAGVAVGLPATLVAALASSADSGSQIGSIDVAIWTSIAPMQAATAWFGTRLAQRTSAEYLSRIMGLALALTGATMLKPFILD